MMLDYLWEHHFLGEDERLPAMQKWPKKDAKTPAGAMTGKDSLDGKWLISSLLQMVQPQAVAMKVRLSLHGAYCTDKVHA
jgi:hypothetical protein